jgi:ElaB/YqjD/DUF883 family membrane-anchored ribosome-binding protein
MSDSHARKAKTGGSGKRSQQTAEENDSFVDQASELVSKVADGTKDLAQRGADVVREQYDRASRGTRAAYDAGMQWEERLEKSIKRNPLTAVAITAGIGLLVGFMLGRESVSRPPQHWWQRYQR